MEPPKPVDNAALPAGNGLLMVWLRREGTSHRALGEHWAPVGSAPLEAWSASGTTEADAVDALMKAMPSFEAWRD